MENRNIKIQFYLELHGIIRPCTEKHGIRPCTVSVINVAETIHPIIIFECTEFLLPKIQRAFQLSRDLRFTLGTCYT